MAEGVDVGVGEGLGGGGWFVVAVDVVGGFLPPAEGRDEGRDLTGCQLVRERPHRSRFERFWGGRLGRRAKESALGGLFEPGVGLDVRARDHAGERVSVGVDRDSMGIVGENVPIDDDKIEIGIVGIDGVDEPVADDNRHREGGGHQKPFQGCFCWGDGDRKEVSSERSHGQPGDVRTPGQPATKTAPPLRC